MATIHPLRSILKKTAASIPRPPATPNTANSTSSSAPTPQPFTAQTKHERDLETALHHAYQLQHRKDVENLILSSTETLLDLPTIPSTPRTVSADIAVLKSLLPPFQPSDYDALIIERNIAGLCGYILCPNLPHSENTKAKYRILGKSGTGAGAGFRIVETKELERWCGEECARRGLYIRVQLGEEPAWMRTGVGVEIRLWEEREAGEKIGASDGAGPTGGGEKEKEAASRNLAVERGEGSGLPGARLVTIKVKEKEIVRPAVPPEISALDADVVDRFKELHLNVDGHQARISQGRVAMAEPGRDDAEDDTDWRI